MSLMATRPTRLEDSQHLAKDLILIRHKVDHTIADDAVPPNYLIREVRRSWHGETRAFLAPHFFGASASALKHIRRVMSMPMALPVGPTCLAARNYIHASAAAQIDNGLARL